MMVHQIKAQKSYRNAKLPKRKTNPKVAKYGNTQQESATAAHKKNYICIFNILFFMC
jgi:hypothetical protein